MTRLLDIEGLSVRIGDKPILNDVNLTLDAGEVLGIIGESGSGKSMTALSIMQLLPEAATATGAIRYCGSMELIGWDERELCRYRGSTFGMVFQEPMTALNPVMTIGAQVAETVFVHGGFTWRQALDYASGVLDRVGLPADLFPRDRYPHELSGGQRQRVVIAMAIALGPALLIADEPTSALDVTTQAQILDLLGELVEEEGMGMILITHDLAVVANRADRLAILRAGEVVETGATLEVFREPKHPYTRALHAASSHVPRRTARQGGSTLLTVEGAVRDYPLARRMPFTRQAFLRAVDNVSLAVARGENVGLVGESGSGKSTLARAIMALEPLQGGAITLDGEAITTEASFSARRKIQVVFQDPYGSFDPRHRVDRLVSEPLHLLGKSAPQGAERAERVARALTEVGLSPEDAHKYIHEFSGGQRQRIAIARALIVEPELIVLDEAVSALDVSIRAQILDLLAALSDRLGVSYLFISHDLSVVRAITDRVLVMRAGEIVEEGETEAVFGNPQHPYTQQLITATPSLEAALAGREVRGEGHRPADQ